MLEVQNLSKTYNPGKKNALAALHDVSLTIADGEMVAVTGTSGAGKSTLLHILGGVLSFDTGSYHLDGEEVGNLSEKKLAVLRNRKVGTVFQSFLLLPDNTVRENVEIPLLFARVPKKKRRALCQKALEQAGIPDLSDRPVSALSGGQKQRAAIARAIVNQAQYILADEPTGALDSRATEALLNLFGDINAEGQTILMVTHSVKAAAHAGRVLFLRDGEVYHQLYRGGQTVEQMFGKISDTLTVMTQGGELDA